MTYMLGELVRHKQTHPIKAAAAHEHVELPDEAAKVLQLPQLHNQTPLCRVSQRLQAFLLHQAVLQASLAAR